MTGLVGEVEALWLKWNISIHLEISSNHVYYSIWRVYIVGYKLLCNTTRVGKFSRLTKESIQNDVMVKFLADYKPTISIGMLSFQTNTFLVKGIMWNIKWQFSLKTWEIYFNSQLDVTFNCFKQNATHETHSITDVSSLSWWKYLTPLSTHIFCMCGHSASWF